MEKPQTSGGTPTILSSLALFYKKYGHEAGGLPLLGYISGNRKTLISPVIMINKRNETLIPVFSSRKEDCFSCRSEDTLYTAWFELEEITDLHFIMKGNSPNLMNLSIERKFDARSFNIQFNPATNRKYRSHKIITRNAGSDKFRFVLTKSEDGRFVEEMILGAINDDLDYESQFKRIAESENSEQILDFNVNTESFLSVYPNPADEEIYVTALLPVEYAAEQAAGAIDLRMYSSIGEEVYRLTCAPGETVIIPTSGMPTGMYVIRTNPASQNRTTHPLHTTQTVIINL
jgi:hypothetical protein